MAQSKMERTKVERKEAITVERLGGGIRIAQKAPKVRVIRRASTGGSQHATAGSAADSAGGKPLSNHHTAARLAEWGS